MPPRPGERPVSRHADYPFVGRIPADAVPGLLSAVVVHYRGEEDLLACIASLADAPRRPLELVLVDNGSGDGAVEKAARRAQEASLRPRVLALPDNLGFAAAADLGLRAARGERLLLLNPDAILEPGCLAALEAALDQGAAVAAPRILLADAPERIDNCGHALYPDGLNWCRGRGEPAAGAFEEAEDVLLCSGAAVLFDRTALVRTGGLDRDYFAYGEDADLSLRAARAGLRIAYVPGARVRHRVGGSFGRLSAWKVFLVERNRARVALTHLPLGALLLSPLWTAARHAALGVSALQGGGPVGGGLGPAAAAATLLAHAASLLDLPGGLARRRAARSFDAISPAEWRGKLSAARVGPRELARRPRES